MKKTLIGIIILLVIGLALYVITSKNRSDKTLTSGCDQSATTTDCARLAEIYPPADPVPTTELKEIVWRKYSNDELGISFSYPTKNVTPENWQIRPGDTGRIFGANIDLGSGAQIHAYALTKDYSAPKDSPGGAAEGYIIQNGKYYAINRGKPVSISFTPDEIWKLNNGKDVPVIFAKAYNRDDLYPPSTQAVVNIPNSNFTGIVFLLYQKYEKGLYRPFTSDDLKIFKKVVTSVEFVK